MSHANRTGGEPSGGDGAETATLAAGETGQPADTADAGGAAPPASRPAAAPGAGPAAARDEASGAWAGAALVALGVVAWAVVFGRLVQFRTTRYGAFDFDMGIYNQAVWLISHGRHFMTVRGLPVFAHHVNANLYLFAPLSWLGLASSQMLSLVQVAAVALCPAPVYALAKRRLGSGWLAAPLALAFLAHPSAQWVTWELFHPEVMAMLPLLVAYACAAAKRWRWFAASAAFAVLWKEDVALAVIMLGLLLALKGERKIGLGTAGAAALWFLVCTKLIIPAFLPEGPFYTQMYGEVGDSAMEIALSPITKPDVVLRQLDKADAVGYVAGVAAPYGLLPLASPAALIGAPQTLLNLLSIQDFIWNIRYHYVAMPLVALTIALVEVVALLARWRRPLAWAAVLLVAVCAFNASVRTGVGPFSRDYRSGVWPLDPSPRYEVMDRAAALVPPEAVVAATYNFVPPLAQRPEIFSFPNPWKGVNWGIRDDNPRDPASVEYLVIDRRVLNDPANASLFAAQLAPAGPYEVIFEQDDVVVARR